MGKMAMSINWGEYEVYHPGTFAPVNTLPRSEARLAFVRLMEAKPHRIGMLRGLLVRNGVELTSADSAIHDLNDWFRANVEADPEKPGRLLGEWYSIVNDIALFLGDAIIERCPRLDWEFFVWGKKNVSYQRPVIMGFTKVANAKYNMDIHMVVAAYAHRIVASRGSIPMYGRVAVKGVEIDIDAVIGDMRRPPEVEGDAFLQLVKLAESQV
jgi:hypothetical protein